MKIALSTRDPTHKEHDFCDMIETAWFTPEIVASVEIVSIPSRCRKLSDTNDASEAGSIRARAV